MVRHGSAPALRRSALCSLLAVCGAAKYQTVELEAGIALDDAHLTELVTMPSATARQAACGTHCRTAAACAAFSVQGDECRVYSHVAAVASIGSGQSRYFKRVDPAEILLLRHDARQGELFPAFDGTWSHNKDQPDGRLFSMLDELDDFKGNDGLYNFRICYPLDLGYDDCYVFDQSSDPRATASTVAPSDFKLHAFPEAHPNDAGSSSIRFVGLNRGKAAAKTWLDGNAGSSAWFYAIGSAAWMEAGGVTYTGEIPAFTSSGGNARTKMVELYVLVK